MLTSQNKLQDMEAQKLMLEAMEISVRTGNMGIAKEIGTSSVIMSNRIKTKDYSIEDAHDQYMQEVRDYFVKGGENPKPGLNARRN